MSLEQIKMDLEKDIVKNKSKLETWKRVTYLTKKDGSPYKIMAKNFENAKYGSRFNTFYMRFNLRAFPGYAYRRFFLCTCVLSFVYFPAFVPFVPLGNRARR